MNAYFTWRVLSNRERRMLFAALRLAGIVIIFAGLSACRTNAPPTPLSDPTPLTPPDATASPMLPPRPTATPETASLPAAQLPPATAEASIGFNIGGWS